jgi:cell division protein FtsB
MPVRETASPWLKFFVVVVGLGLLALVVHTLFGQGGYMDLQKRQAEVDQLKEKVESLENENRRLTGEIKELKTDPEAIERVAREQLKMARPGETVITLPEKEEKESPPN